MCNEIPLLTENDVELRVQQVSQTNYSVYAVLLAYKNARVDMKILDSTFGVLNWQRKHEVVDGKLLCTVSVYDAEKNSWVGKQDVGTESNTEAEKGQVSDAFKRACVNWGIGRELYDAPFIRIKLNDNEVVAGSNGKPKTYAKFHVQKMVYDRELGRFTTFTVVDEAGNIRFDLTKSNTAAGAQVTAKQNTIPINVPTMSNPEQIDNSLSCSECGNTITPKVMNFSKSKFGRALCYNCQKRLAA